MLLEWNLDVKCFTMAWSLWTLRVWLKVKKAAARLLLFTPLCVPPSYAKITQMSINFCGFFQILQLILHLDFQFFFFLQILFLDFSVLQIFADVHAKEQMVPHPRVDSSRLYLE